MKSLIILLISFVFLGQNTKGGTFDGLHKDPITKQYVPDSKKASTTATAGPSVELGSNPTMVEAKSEQMIAPEPEVKEVKVAEKTEMVEEREKPVMMSAQTKRGLWVKNTTKKNLHFVAHRYGAEDLDMGILGAEQEIFLPAAKNMYSLTFKGTGFSSWFFRRDIQQSFTNGSTAEVYKVAIR